MTALITLEEAKSRLPIRPGNDQFDGRATAAITAVQSQIETFCRRSFDRVARSEVFHVQAGSQRNIDLMNAHNTDGYVITPDGRPFYLTHTPIDVETVKVFYDINHRFGEDTELFPDDFYVLEDKGCVFVYRPMLRSRDSVRITYTGGFTEVPVVVKEACIMQVTHYLKRTMVENVSTSSDKDSGAAKEAYPVKGGLLPEVKNLLLPYIKPLRSRS